MYLIGFPLLVITFAIYNMIAFLTPSLTWTASVVTIHLHLGAGLDRDAGGHHPGVRHPAAAVSRSSRRPGWASAD